MKVDAAAPGHVGELGADGEGLTELVEIGTLLEVSDAAGLILTAAFTAPLKMKAPLDDLA